MENFAELMQRLLEIQSGGRQRSPELIAEDVSAEASREERHLEVNYELAARSRYCKQESPTF
jgi:hypothetical protein